MPVRPKVIPSHAAPCCHKGIPSHAIPCHPMPPQGNPIQVCPMGIPFQSTSHAAPCHHKGIPSKSAPCPYGRLGWDALEVDLDGITLWQHGVAWDGMSLGQTWMGCPCSGLGWDALGADLDGIDLDEDSLVAAWGRLGWDALVADLDGMPLQQTWMGFPCGSMGQIGMGCPWGGLGWDRLGWGFPCSSMGQTGMGCPCGGLGWDALAADLDGIPLVAWGSMGWDALWADLDGMPLNTAFTNPTYTVASHIARITKSGNAKFWQLPWQQNILLKISKSSIDKSSIHSGKSLCWNY